MEYQTDVAVVPVNQNRHESQPGSYKLVPNRLKLYPK
jgi:hypothetical protein